MAPRSPVNTQMRALDDGRYSTPGSGLWGVIFVFRRTNPTEVICTYASIMSMRTSGSPGSQGRNAAWLEKGMAEAGLTWSLPLTLTRALLLALNEVNTFFVLTCH